ncbi:hypothetical protein RDI58_018937 [Solanum bulbocastanum]|uniref:Beta-glucosidase n=1 Tax=Solanum bulbocastanum TaxID=147425 RepID=A0AAN8TI91_SOLBU
MQLLDPLVYGDYPIEMRHYLGTKLPIFNGEEKILIKNSTDFIGLNHYTTYFAKDCLNSNCTCMESDVLCTHGENRAIRGYVLITGQKDGAYIGDQMGMPGLYVVPQGMEDIVDYVNKRYNNLPIFVTENGKGYASNENQEGYDMDQDRKRIKYHKAYLASLARSIRLPVRSLLRFKCASKFWKTLISSDHFKAKHYNHAKNNKKILITRVLPDHTTSYYCSSLSSPQPLQKLGCCPSNNKPNRLGYDSISDDYKILKIDNNGGDSSRPPSKILALKCGSWRKIDNYPRIFHNSTYRNDPLTFVCGSFHWISKDDEDIDLMASLGVNAYRFSISWSRILPRIIPFVTIHHNDYPQEFEDRFQAWLSPLMQLLDPLVYGDYPIEMRHYLGTKLPIFSGEEKILIKNSTDFIGLNHYTTYFAKDCLNSNCTCMESDILCTHGENRAIRGYVLITGQKDGAYIGDQMGMPGSYVVPQGMEDIIDYVNKRYNNLPIFVTENGKGYASNENQEGYDMDQDRKRIKYHKAYLASLARSISFITKVWYTRLKFNFFYMQESFQKI